MKTETTIDVLFANKAQGAKKLAKPVLKAEQTLFRAASQALKSVTELGGIAKGLLPEGAHFYERWCLFELHEWMDNLNSHVSTRASFNGRSGHETGGLLMIALRAKQTLGDGVYYRLVLEVEHPEYKTTAWIDAETGQVHKTKPWLKFEEEQRQKGGAA